MFAAHDDAAHVSARGIAALEGLVASLGPAHVGDCAAILIAGLHAGAAASHAGIGTAMTEMTGTTASPIPAHPLAAGQARCGATISRVRARRR